MTERRNEMVYMTVGPEYDDGELVARSELPDDAFRAALDVDGSHLDGGTARMYEVWTVER